MGLVSQCAESMRIALGLGSALAQAWSSAIQSGSSSRGGAPCARKMAGMRLGAAADTWAPREAAAAPTMTSRRFIDLKMRRFGAIRQSDGVHYCVAQTELARARNDVVGKRAGRREC